ncbi:hypothetical protein AS189_16340 [Arthrobacter alpinus]|uniref:Uncharacterized protein n=1 Tax=Arthrobacter alpinus TaxID=656366 RepID=A0A0S2M289_9MICC|nr:hypothetical protein [Arthrobacter alpinus]ALO67758.1 hypothetical protein AS189_16340 [Arthrobacter alpinus]
MNRSSESRQFASDSPFYDLRKLSLAVKSSPGPGTLAGADLNISLIQVDQAEQLAGEITGLVLDLRDKLGCYLALQNVESVDHVARIDTESAVEWMEKTIDDLVATIVGISTESTKIAAEVTDL